MTDTDDLNLRVARACNFEHRSADGLVEITYVNERGITVEKYFRPQTCWDDAMLGAKHAGLFSSGFVLGTHTNWFVTADISGLNSEYPVEYMAEHESGPTCVSLAICKLKETANAEVG